MNQPKLSRLIKPYLLLLTIVFLGFFAVRPLLAPGFFTMHDDQQVARLFELDKSLSFGQFPVRWVKDLGFGYGYPLFNFYPPLVYYLGETSHLLLDASFIDSTKIVWLLALLGSAVAMYFLAREFFGEVGGVVSSLFYLYAPYHAVDAYVRGALAELFSFVWLPLILLFTYKIVRENNFKNVIWTGIFLALLMITHNLVFLPFFGLVGLWYFGLVIIYDRYRLIRYTLYFILYTLLCFGLTAFFWAPALWEKKYTLVDQLLIKSLASYKIHFVCLNQLWDSPWGYGGSAAGCVDGLSFKIGKLHVIMSAISVFLAIYFWLKRNLKLALVIITANFLFLLSAFLTTGYAAFIWDKIPPLWYLQFPWRLLEFVVLFSSFSAGAVVLLFNNKWLKFSAALISIMAVIFLNAKLFVPQEYRTVTDLDLTSNQEIRWHVSSTSFEYLPKDFATKLTDLGSIWADIDKTQIAKSDYRVISDNLDVTSAQIIPDRFLLDVAGTAPSVLSLSITNFPGWQLWLDDRPAKIHDDNPYKLITVNVPQGRHTILAQFTNTPIRTAGNVVSLAFLTGLVLYGFRNGVRRSS